MKNLKMLLERKKYLALGGVIAVCTAIYIVNMTHSALWFDESIEYFYSKVMVGKVPGGYETTNMYQRICRTYQPPLYNILMYLWLLFFDFGEASFRLLGVLVTMAGAVGIFLCIDKLCDAVTALMGTLFYIFASGIIDYTLECAEYYLMICCLCWTLYFFVCAYTDNKFSSLLGFFLFACLSVYSQYGAVFPVIALYLILAVQRLHTRTGVRQFVMFTGITGIVAVIPLLIFFLFPQLHRQGTTAVSHVPYFANGFVKDFLQGIRYIFWMTFTLHNYGFLSQNLVPILLVLAMVMVFVVLLKRDKICWVLFSVCAVSYLLYFILVACTFYAHASADRMGTGNLGGRYALFFAPFVVVLLVYGIHAFVHLINKPAAKTLVLILGAVALTAYCSSGIHMLFAGWEKDDVRGVTDAWYTVNADKDITLVDGWYDANFQFYLRHNKNYRDSMQKNILTTTSLMNEPTVQDDDLKHGLQTHNILSHDTIYYITSGEGIVQLFSILEDYGYRSEVLYDHLATLYCFTR